MSEPTATEIVIEIDEERHNEHLYLLPPDGSGKQQTKSVRAVSGNNNLYFFPLERTVRGRFEVRRFGRGFQLDQPVQQIDFIPGERIHVDLEKRIGRITDALGDKENAPLYEQLRGLAMELQLPVLLQPPNPDTVVDLRDDMKFWTWVFWMRRIVDSGCMSEHDRRTFQPNLSVQCRPVQNVHQLPSYVECVRSCKVNLPIYEAQVRQALNNERKHANEPGFEANTGVLTPTLAGLKEVAA